jgi:shikimate kinase
MVFLIGFMGSGKTWYGRRLASEQGALFIDLDHYITAQEQRSIAALFEVLGEEAFRQLETQYLAQVCEQYKGQAVVVATGGGTPCFNDNLALMRAHGRTVWVRASLPTIVARLRPERAHRPLLASVPDVELEGFIGRLMEQREGFYAQADEVVWNE